MSENRLLLDRRSLLATGSALATVALSGGAKGLARLALGPAFAQDQVPRSLLLLQLTGGNDGLSTIVPYGDDHYLAARSTSRINPEEVLRIDDYRGFHPELKRLRACYDRGHFAIVEGTGFAKSSRSHFEAMDVWHAASPEGRAAGEGWIGRLSRTAWKDERAPNRVVHIGLEVPYSLHSPECPPVSFELPVNYRWAGDARETDAMARAARSGSGDKAARSGSAAAIAALRDTLRRSQSSSAEVREACARYEPKVAYTGGEFSDALRAVAALVTAQIGSRVYSIEIAGFDNHAMQRYFHDRTLRTLDRDFGIFLEDLEGTEAGKNLLVLVFSEFGRHLYENGAGGTDHGAAGPMFLMGPAVKGGIYGKHPSLADEDLDQGDPAFTTDFRSVYATVIERWFGVPHETVLRDRFPLLDVV